MRVRAALLGLVTATSLFAGLIAPAFALTQPNGAPIPSPMGCSGNAPTGLLAAMACACTQPGICNIGAACPGGATACDNGQHGTCEATLWHSPNDNSCIPSNESGLNPSTQATITPETFHPTCGQTFTVISRGTAQFQDVFGWYNATTTGLAPDPGDLHVMLACGATAGTSVTLDVAKDPSYKGGDIGFFLLTPEDHAKAGSCAAGDCCPTVARFQAGQGYVYYSQRELNPDTSATAPYIHLLIMDGTIAPNRYYYAWEDTFDTSSADFTDLVTAVDGVECSGAGATCTTGLKGTCAMGITECASGATAVTCQQLFQPQPETCDGLDDDCDGVVDNGATCPSAIDVCVDGQCVGSCGNTENPCIGGLSCDQTSGRCVEPKCIGVTCGADQVCTAGQCVSACEGVTCPEGQTCVSNQCLDLCKGVSCSSGQVCRDGLCFAGCAACGGITCSAPLACDATSGACVDPSCAQTCPTGTVCSSGTCVDACSGVVCPGGAACANGECGSPSGADAGPSGFTGGGTSPTSGGPGLGSGSGDGGANAETGFGSASSAGCGCSVPRADTDRAKYAGVFFAALAVSAIASRRQRRRRAS